MGRMVPSYPPPVFFPYVCAPLFKAAANREAEMDNDGDGVITLDEVKAHDRDVEIVEE